MKFSICLLDIDTSGHQRPYAGLIKATTSHCLSCSGATSVTTPYSLNTLTLTSDCSNLKTPRKPVRESCPRRLTAVLFFFSLYLRLLWNIYRYLYQRTSINIFSFKEFEFIQLCVVLRIVCWTPHQMSQTCVFPVQVML